MIESRVVHLEDRSEELLAPALLCHKEPARRIQSPLLRALERKIPLGGYFACSSLVLYGIRVPIINPFCAGKPPIQATPRPSSTNESGPGLLKAFPTNDSVGTVQLDFLNERSTMSNRLNTISRLVALLDEGVGFQK